jgi:hypothetical protein
MAQVQQSFELNLHDVNENLPWAFGEGELTSLSTSFGWLISVAYLTFLSMKEFVIPIDLSLSSL